MTATIAELTGLQGDYISSWDSFVGQKQAVTMLKIATKSAKMRGEPLEHLFFSGGAGLGKTQLAVLCAAEMGHTVTSISGQMDVNRFRMLLTDLEDGDVILWEEFHLALTGGRNKLDFLLNFLQDHVVIGPNGILEDAPRVTVIATTTEPGKMPEAILTRFRKVELGDYSDDEAVMIAESWVERVLDPLDLPYPSGGNLSTIARAAVNNPRNMRQIFLALRDVTIALEKANWDDAKGMYDMDMVLDFLGLTEDGLSKTAQRYLVLLAFKMGGSAGEKPLMDALNEPGGLRHVEKGLTDLGYVIKTGRGRELSSDGMRRAKQLKEAGVK